MCVNPLHRYVEGKLYHLPCGKCSECIKHSQNEWCFRLHQEQLYTSLSGDLSVCVTLTYDDENVPCLGFIDKDGKFHLADRKSDAYCEEKGINKRSYGSILLYSDVQKWLKRIRRNTNWKFRYFACAEYGGKSSRAHYHILMFGLPNESLLSIKNKLFSYWRKCSYECFVVDFVTRESIRYCTKYLNKVDKRNHIVPPRTYCSKNLGLCWLTENIKHWLLDSMPMFVTYNGYKYPIPRYYKKKVFDTDEIKAKYYECVMLNKSAFCNPVQEKLNKFVEDVANKLLINGLKQCNDFEKVVTILNKQLFWLHKNPDVNAEIDPFNFYVKAQFSTVKADYDRLVLMASNYIEDHTDMSSCIMSKKKRDRYERKHSKNHHR